MATERKPTARERARTEMVKDIKRAARERLAVDGANLSLRAVARDLGVVSSATYRYFASRDELLTALIIDAYDDLGEAVEQAEAAVPRRDLRGRWLATARAVRAWASANPHEYALLYGSPVPGYAAPRETVGPASRPVLVMVGILRDAVGRGAFATPPERLPKALRQDLVALTGLAGYEHVPPAVMARGLGVWAQLFGIVSFELFGRLTGAITDYDAFFDHQAQQMAERVGV
jgi:AcrR family transcriptional regulator